MLASLFKDDETDMFRLDGYEQLSVEHGQFGSETAGVAIRAASPVGALALSAPAGEELWGYQLWVTEGAATVFRGPVHNAKLSSGGRGPAVEIAAEGHLQHALRRRCNWSPTKAVDSHTARPNTIAIEVIDAAIGAIAGPVAPTGYPGGVSRTDWGFSTTYAAGVATGMPTSVTWKQQAGKNVQDVVEELCQNYDMCPVLSRASTASYAINVAYPYRLVDRTASVVLTARRGNSTDFSWNTPYTLTTVARFAGAGSGAAQTDVFTTAGTPTYGTHEDQGTQPEGDLGVCVYGGAAMLRASAPLVTVETSVRNTTGLAFHLDYQWRDLVRVYDADCGRFADQVIVGWKLDAWAGGRGYRYELVLNEPRLSYMRLMAGKTGLPFGRSAGDRWRDTRG